MIIPLDNLAKAHELLNSAPELQQLNFLLDEHPEIVPAIIYLGEQAAKITHESLHDPLTQVGNRRKLDTDLAILIPQIGRGTPSLKNPSHALIAMIDMDGLKDVNDSHGHLAGDEVLKSVARRLMANTQANDSVYRFGGDEFVAVMPIVDRIKQEQIFDIAERVRVATVNELQSSVYQVNGNRVAISSTLSVGATIANAGDTPELVISRADLNLYRAKTSGRNRSFGDNGEIDLTPVVPPGVLPETASS